MPAAAPPLAIFEKQAIAHAMKNSITCGRGDIRRLAKSFRNDWLARHLAEDEVRGTNVLGITRSGVARGLSDPTPREAFRQISKNDHAAARRLGLHR